MVRRVLDEREKVLSQNVKLTHTYPHNNNNNNKRFLQSLVVKSDRSLHSDGLRLGDQPLAAAGRRLIARICVCVAGVVGFAR